MKINKRKVVMLILMIVLIYCDDNQSKVHLSEDSLVVDDEETSEGVPVVLQVYSIVLEIYASVGLMN